MRRKIQGLMTCKNGLAGLLVLGLCGSIGYFAPLSEGQDKEPQAKNAAKLDAYSYRLRIEAIIEPTKTAAIYSVQICQLAPERDQRRIQGKWILVKVYFDGKEAFGLTEGAYAKFEGMKFVGVFEDARDQYGYSLDESTTPKQMNLYPLMKAAVPALYELNGDQLRIIFSTRENGIRPKNFEETNGIQLWILKRAKK